MAKNRNASEIKLIESGWGVLTGFNHVLITLAAAMGLPSGALYRLGTPEGHETLFAATRAFLAEVAKTVPAVVWRTVISGPNRDQLVAGAKAIGRTISEFALRPIAKMTITHGLTYRLVVISGDEFATDNQRTFANVCAVAKLRGCRTPTAEVALLLALFRQEELGHPILVVMHEPVRAGLYNQPYVLVVLRNDTGGEWVGMWDAGSGRQFSREHAFVFLAPEEATA